MIAIMETPRSVYVRVLYHGGAPSVVTVEPFDAFRPVGRVKSLDARVGLHAVTAGWWRMQEHRWANHQAAMPRAPCDPQNQQVERLRSVYALPSVMQARFDRLCDAETVTGRAVGVAVVRQGDTRYLGKG